ncbi:GbsR/MarR family transcriptional regulator [Luteimicrobium subarcticum]|uniref:MarR family protein n=1 Tax=Luteimicrobium subarcticum TaxID=620910 RepID=A0A2M8WV51_9MICO|nr:helix-turn-helix domain-containing protein [Luteimicrobium subarcticum]PJI94798.1 MarR family protein [Luteimicrobium subarcticum]
MPGGRLGAQERRQIEAGLADGLTYAAIARRIDRPTSTVTREVTRNGGATAYRADRAQRATGRRAQRQARAAGAGTPGTAGWRDAEAVRAYEESFTAMMERSGLARMPSRVLTSLYLVDDGSATAAELVQHLGVSAASVSKAVALLESIGMIRREKGEGRRERYVVDDDVWYQSMVASARVNAELAAASRQGAQVLGAGTPAADRLERVARYMEFVSDIEMRAADEAREMLSGPS